MPSDCYRQCISDGAYVGRALVARWLDRQIVVLARLGLDFRDSAERARAKSVLSAGVGVTAGGEQPDVVRRVVRRTSYLIEVAAVRRIQRANGTVGGYTRGTCA